MLNVDAKIMKNLVLFMMESTQLNFDESFYNSLSEENKSYLLKSYSKLNEENSFIDEKFDVNKEPNESNGIFDNPELIESKSINSNSYVKVDLDSEK
jgi:hypothetical protein